MIKTYAVMMVIGLMSCTTWAAAPVVKQQKVAAAAVAQVQVKPVEAKAQVQTVSAASMTAGTQCKVAGAGSMLNSIDTVTVRNRAKMFADNDGVGSSGTKYVHVSDKDIKGITDIDKLQAILSPEVKADDKKVKRVAVAVDLHSKPLVVSVPKGEAFGVGAVRFENSKIERNVEVEAVVVNVDLHVVGR